MTRISGLACDSWNAARVNGKKIGYDLNLKKERDNMDDLLVSVNCCKSTMTPYGVNNISMTLYIKKSSENTSSGSWDMRHMVVEGVNSYYEDFGNKDTLRFQVIFSNQDSVDKYSIVTIDCLTAKEYKDLEVDYHSEYLIGFSC